MKFAVTGIGILNGLGSTVEENWQNLLAGKTAIKQIDWPEDNPKKFPKTHKSITVTVGAPSPTPEFTKEEFSNKHKYWDRCTKMGVYTANQALLDSGLESKNVGIVFSTVNGATATKADVMRSIEDGRVHFSPKSILNGTYDYLSGVIARQFDLNGMTACLHDACATGLYSLDYAIKSLIVDPDLDAIIVGGVDTPIEAMGYYYFQTLGALSQDTADIASRPFNKQRTGFVPGEGSACIIIEPLEKAIKRNAKIYGIVLGTGLATVGHHETDPDPLGLAPRLAVSRALKMAKIDASQINYVNAHATGTPAGDEIEFNAMRDLFPGVVMTANKGQIGHTLGASGVFETIYTILALRDQMSPPIANLKDPVGDGMILPTEAMPIKARYAIKNNFAFGGRSACAILEQYNGDQNES
jgi:3-oxoacyl-[acyl-carrier-protein] synthase II